MSHVRSSDGDVLGIATRESERRRNLANPLEFSTPRESSPDPPAHPALLPRWNLWKAAPRAPPQYPRHPPSLIAKTKHMLPIYHQDILASNICRVNSSLCCIMHEIVCVCVCVARADPRPNESRALVLHGSLYVACRSSLSR